MTQFNRAEIEKSVQGLTYPADKETILSKASANGADQATIDVLNTLLPGIYNGTDEVIEALESIDGTVYEASEEVD